MSLHKGMKFVFTKGKTKGRRGTVKDVQGNEVTIKTSNGKRCVNKANLEKRVKWL